MRLSRFIVTALLLAPPGAIQAADTSDIAVDSAKPAGKIRAQPNVLLLLADDLGYADLGVQGCRDVPTPNLDAIARGGVRFTAGYVSAPVCSPSRAGLVTGRYQTRFGHEFNHPLADRAPVGLPATAKTAAQWFHEAGYATGHIGKWHLGNPNLPAFHPNARGFAESVWFPGQKKLPPLQLYRNAVREVVDDRYVDEAMAREAAAFVARHRSEPWFLYVAFLTPHQPLDVPPGGESPLAGIADPTRRKCAAMIALLDHSVGVVMQALRDSGQEERTLVVFLSDNGAPPKNGSRNTPLAGGKGTTWEGGIREPLLMSWKGVLPAGRTVDEPVISLDLLPTALAAAGIDVPAAAKLDGVNLLPFLTGKTRQPPHAALFWRYGEQMAVRAGDWKLTRALDPQNKNLLMPRPRLFQIVADPAEQHDQAAAQPEKVLALQRLWDAWNKENVAPLWTQESAAAAAEERKADAAADDAPERGVRSVTPGKRWEDALVTGNGRMGAMLFGSPADETFVANHCRLFLPLGNREIVPDLARHVPELRRVIRQQDYGQAMKFFLGKAKEQGYPGLTWTDKFHPGALIHIRQPAEGVVQDYQRTENFATGEVVERWRDRRGEFRRRLFVSRDENLIVLSLTGPAPCELEFPAVEHELIESHQETTPEWVLCHNIYAKGKGGFDTAVRIVRRNEGRDVLLLVRIAPWKTPMPKEESEAWAYSSDNPDFKTPGVFRPSPPLAESSVVAYRTTRDALALLPALKASLAGVAAEYEALLAPHAALHGALFNRVTLDLGGGADRARTSEELLDLARREDRLPAALMEKMYDAGRYMLICSAGELAPNLQGIWTGSWNASWSGDFTLDTNLQSAMASACSANLPDLMQGYFRLMEGFYPEWRLNAKRIYGCRGFFTNARASNTALELHWGGWQGVFWTAGCGWLASFFSDYADYTGDREFRARRCVPLLKEIAAFYEDFLIETDAEGRVVFIPSYNPETACGVNATMDIAVARETLMRLIAACRELDIERENLPRWESLLARLPAYPVNPRGELVEFPGGKVNPGHRHHSQLYPCFQSFDPLLETDAPLRAAAQATVRAKIAASDLGGKGNEDSSFGRVQAGISAAYLRIPEEAYSRLKVMAVKRSMNPSLITSHNPNARTFNTDGNGGIPQIVNTMLLFSRPGQIDLLPALPKAWPSGQVTGLRARGDFTVDIQWKDGKVVGYRIASPQPREVKVRVNGEVKTVIAENATRSPGHTSRRR